MANEEEMVITHYIWPSQSFTILAETIMELDRFRISWHLATIVVSPIGHSAHLFTVTETLIKL